MKRIIALITLSIALYSCNSGGKADLKTPEDKASYSIGVLNAEGLLNQAKNPMNQDTLDYDLVKKGMEDFLNLSYDEKQSYYTGMQMAYSIYNLEKQNNLKDKFSKDLLLKGFAHRLGEDSTKLAITSDSTFYELSEYFKTVNPEMSQGLKNQFDRKVQGTKNVEEGKNFLAKNKKKAGVKTTKSGLQYEVITEGSGKTPKATDKVKVLYKGTTLDGKVFDETKDGEPREFGVGQVVPGWTEGLQLMKEGGKYKFYVPAELAYGEQGNQNIAPNATLIFEVELISVTENTQPAGGQQGGGMQLTPEQIQQMMKQQQGQ